MLGFESQLTPNTQASLPEMPPSNFLVKNTLKHEELETATSDADGVRRERTTHVDARPLIDN